MIISHPIDGVTLLMYPTQPELTIRFARLQEYYESPYDNIRNKVFSWEEFLLSHYGDKRIQKESYFNYWEGFNVPVDVAKRFFSSFKDLSQGEVELRELIRIIPDTKYLIASFEGANTSVVDHELAHARFALDSEYKYKVINFLNKFDANLMLKLSQSLLREGYTYEVIQDEIQAYLLTSTNEELLSLFDNLDVSIIKEKLKEIL